jgi:hypothetical protein
MKIIILLIILTFNLTSCKENKHLNFFKDTPAYNLADATYNSDFKKIVEILKKDADLLEYQNPISGGNVLEMCIHTENLESFKKLLDLGANPNFINKYSKFSILMTSIKYYGSQFEWRENIKFLELLLEKGADPNYSIPNEFIDEKNRTQFPNSPLFLATSFSIEYTELLIQYGADPFYKLPQNEKSILCKAIYSNNDIAKYYIENFDFNLEEPIEKLKMVPGDELQIIYIQDKIMDEYIYAKLYNDEEKLKYFKDTFPHIIENGEERWELVKLLQEKGVDFINHNYIDEKFNKTK